MRKVRSALLFLCAVAVVLLVLVPTAGAAQKVAASGIWAWGPDRPGDVPTLVRQANDNWFLTGAGWGYFTGTFEGDYEATYAIVFFQGGKSLLMKHAITFTGSVNGVAGTAEMRFTCRPQMWLNGNWEVIGGTGGLKHLVGHGSWTFAPEPWPDGWALMAYTGTVWLP